MHKGEPHYTDCSYPSYLTCSQIDVFNRATFILCYKLVMVIILYVLCAALLFIIFYDYGKVGITLSLYIYPYISIYMPHNFVVLYLL